MSLEGFDLDGDFKVNKKTGKITHRSRDRGTPERYLDDLGRDLKPDELKILLDKWNKEYEKQKEELATKRDSGEITEKQFKQECRIARTRMGILRDWRKRKLGELADKETLDEPDRYFFDETGVIRNSAPHGEIGEPYFYAYDKEYSTVQIRDKNGNIIGNPGSDCTEDVDEWLDDSEDKLIQKEKEKILSNKEKYKQWEYTKQEEKKE